MTAHVPALPYPRPTAQVEPYVQVLGTDLAIAFLLEFGGAELYIAKAPKGRHEFEALVGPDKAKALAAISHRLPRRVPLAKRWIAACLLARGMSAAQIARKLRVSDVSVLKWLSICSQKGG